MMFKIQSTLLVEVFSHSPLDLNNPVINHFFFRAFLDLCASFLLACLFCKFWDCVLTVGDGCQYCVASICSSICSKACCCDPSAVDVFVDFCPCCSCAEYMEVCGCSCGESAFDCSICDLCLQTTECLELGMELSQLLFH